MAKRLTKILILFLCCTIFNSCTKEIKPKRIFSSDYSLQLEDCVGNSGIVELPFLPYGTSAENLEEVLGVTKECFDITWNNAAETLDFSDLEFILEEEKAYIGNVSMDSKTGFYDAIELVIIYDNISYEEVNDIKEKLLSAVEEIAPNKSLMHYLSTDGKTTIYCNVMPLEQLEGSPVGIRSIIFSYEY